MSNDWNTPEAWASWEQGYDDADKDLLPQRPNDEHYMHGYDAYHNVGWEGWDAD